jgi:chaperonin cofactor prefoldin
MADEDKLQSQIDFIVTNQAQFAADIQELKNLNKQAEKRMSQVEDVCLRLGSALVNLTDHVAEIAVAQTHLETKMADMATAQEHADQRLSALIDIVMEQRNGRNRS